MQCRDPVQSAPTHENVHKIFKPRSRQIDSKHYWMQMVHWIDSAQTHTHTRISISRDNWAIWMSTWIEEDGTLFVFWSKPRMKNHQQVEHEWWPRHEWVLSDTSIASSTQSECRPTESEIEKKNVCSVFIVWYNVCHLTEIDPSDKLSSHLIYELKWKEEINDFMLRSFILCLSWWWYFFILCVFSLTLIVLLLSVWKIHKWNQRKRFAMNYIGFDCSDINIGHFCLPHIWDRFIHSRISAEFHLVYSPFIVHSWFYTFRWNFSA